VSTATELLRRALEALVEEAQYRNDIMFRWHDVFLDIRTFLATETEAEPVAWVDMTDKELKEIHVEEQFGLFCDADEFVDIARAAIAKFKYQNRTRPEPSKKPMTEEEIEALYICVYAIPWIKKGIRAAKRHHGITE